MSIASCNKRIRLNTYRVTLIKKDLSKKPVHIFSPKSVIMRYNKGFPPHPDDFWLIKNIVPCSRCLEKVESRKLFNY